RFRVNAWDSPLENGEEGPAAALFLDKREDAGWIEAVLRAELARPGSGETVFARLWSERKRGGLLPPAPYDVLEEQRLRAQLAARLQEELEPLRARMREHGMRFEGTLRLGPQDSKRAEPPVLNLPALDAAALGLPLRIGGLFPWFFRCESGKGWALR